MKKIIMIKYGELSTKKDNINFFIKTLRDNIKKLLCNSSITYDKGRMFIESNSIDKDLDLLKKVFGIHEINVCYKLDGNVMDDIKTNALEVINKSVFNTFKVESKRSNKEYPIKSPEISREVGGFLLSKLDNKTVDVHNPDIVLNIEIRQDSTIIYCEKEIGLGGYPLGVAGKGLLMLSGGIDSPVAGYLTIKRGVKLEAIYFESPPHTSENAKNKVIELARKLALYNLDIKLHIVNFTEMQETIYKEVPHEYMITILRRMMYRISEKAAKKYHAKILVNGESIGQVASQTLSSMRVINEVIKLPVIRPLACFDKLDIIKISKSIDMYETSILPYEDCCTIFVPKHPVINPELTKCEEYEALFDYNTLVNKCVREMQTIKITYKDDDYKDLL